MRELKFDTEGITSCPMNEIATREDCMDCKYLDIRETEMACIYEDVFPEEEK